MTKLNQALIEWKTGDIHGLKWLESKDLGQRLSYFYHETGVLRKVGPGVYARSKDNLNWLAGIRFLQEESGFPVHVSGRSALELHGHRHYVAFGKEKIFLTSYEKKNFPTWFLELDFGVEFVFRKSSIFDFDKEAFLSEYSKSEFNLKISSRELAVLELIDYSDLSNSLEVVENYMNSLMTLRPDVMQKALESCKSVKVKRVFLFLAEKLELPIVKKLDLKKISLGSGKRLVVKDGELNKKYQITVDRDYGENPF